MNDYFEWMCASVCTDAEGNYISGYSRLLEYLHSVKYEYLISQDENREADGISLRYHYGWENDIPNAVIASELDIYPCSVLEMMVALARRMEADVMGDPEYGNRTYIWFFTMLESMGIDILTDDKFDEFVAWCHLEIFMKRRYLPNGEGGLFTLKCPDQDMRGVEVWDQAMWWLNEYVDEM